MNYNFDTLLNHNGTNSKKWEYYEDVFGTEDVLPLWIADMDFACPNTVTNALIKRAKHPIYGYSGEDNIFFESAVNWIWRRFGIQVEAKRMKTIPGVIPGILAAINAFTKVGDKIIIQPPVYHPFFKTIKDCGRQVVENPLIEDNGQYWMDLDDLKRKISSETRMLILCSPHNPVGRVWTHQELCELANICIQNDIFILSDEIHSDLVFEKGSYTPFYSLPKEISENSLSFIAPSKTFNLAGLFTSIAISGSDRVNREFSNVRDRMGLNHVNLFGMEALKVAYNSGESWLEDVLVYLQKNAEYVSSFLEDCIPQLKMKVPDATYLGWMDCRGLGITDQELNEFMISKARLGMNPGTKFGIQGDGFQRINFGCPRSVLKDAMDRLENAVKNYL